MGFETVKKTIYRVSLAATLIALACEAMALGLGELKGEPVLGEAARLEVELLGSGTRYLDPTCFKLVEPSAESGLPWLKQASFAVRHGTPAVLEIRSMANLRDPAFALAVYVSCGHDIVREYVLLAAKPTAKPGETTAAPAPRSPAAKVPAPRHQAAPARTPLKAVQATPASAVPPPPVPAPVQPPAQAAVQAPVTTQSGEPVKDLPPQESAMAADEKVKAMEAKVGELQQRAAELTQKIEQAAPAPALPVPVVAPVAPPPEGSNWGWYGALLAALAAVGGWFGWRTYGQRSQVQEEALGIPEVVVDPQRKNEREERGGVDLQVDPVAMVTPVKIDAVAPATPPAAGPGSRIDSLMSIAAATVDEHFEANPVMELAEIMLSFGRVKGAAQALQEYIDANPQDALKPWVRLMDVYRMAGMRHEFEKVALELNKNFNVQIQQWDTPGEAAVDVVLDTENAQPPVQAAGAAEEGVESMAWIMEQVMMRWPTGDVIDYLDQLLRDNRGGTRTGFTLSVVNDILFLIDLKEISNKIESEAAKT